MVNEFSEIGFDLYHPRLQTILSKALQGQPLTPKERDKIVACGLIRQNLKKPLTPIHLKIMAEAFEGLSPEEREEETHRIIVSSLFD